MKDKDATFCMGVIYHESAPVYPRSETVPLLFRPSAKNFPSSFDRFRMIGEDGPSPVAVFRGSFSQLSAS
jgi:hypothetical protein